LLSLNKVLIAATFASFAALGGIWLERSAEARGYARGLAEAHSMAQAAANDVAKQSGQSCLEKLTTMNEAQNARQKQLSEARSAGNRALDELGRLRQYIATARVNPVPAVDTASGASNNATIAAELLEQCGAELVGVAAQADGHAADSLMYQLAWPKE
jgi:hypothetical protein